MATQQASASPQQAGKRICMLVYTFYEHDNRVMRYARTLVERGDEVDVIALGTGEKQPTFERIDGVNVYRIQRRQRNERNKYSYLFRLVRFCLKSSFVLGRRHLKNAYDLVHVHNVPDFLVFSAWLPRLGGAKIILDIHDIMPEFFANKFHKPQGNIYVRMLKWVEFVSARFADHVIVSNHLWRDKITARSVPRERCSVFINHVDGRLFQPHPRRKNNDKPVVIFPGGLQFHQGVDIAIRAIGELRRRLPGVELHIYGEGNMKPSMVHLAEELRLNGSVRFFNPVPIRDIARIMAEADLGVVPKRADSFGNEAFSTKIMEFMSLQVPVVVSGTKIDRYYFDDSIVRFFESGNPVALAQAMFEVLSNDELRQAMVMRAAEYAKRQSWENYKSEYLGLVDGLCGGRPLAQGAGRSE
jgi:glycosyltransferase involved in cell wall biosynthesis